MEQVRVRPDEPEEQAPTAGDYYVLSTGGGTFYVTAETAARIGRVLDRRWMRPRWLKFVDWCGARVWLRTEEVDTISESTERQRELWREFYYRQRKEDQADRRWDDEVY